MSYRDENTNWRFTVPQAGEVDSAETVTSMLEEVDDALLGPMRKAELISHGSALNPASYTDGADSTYSTAKDNYWTEQEGFNVYVTRAHYHPTQTKVPYAEEAGHAEESDHALRSDVASKLSPGILLNGKLLTGEGASAGEPQVANILLNDIPNAPRVFWGTPEPSENPSLPAVLRRGDIYVKVLA